MEGVLTFSLVLVWGGGSDRGVGKPSPTPALQFQLLLVDYTSVLGPLVCVRVLADPKGAYGDPDRISFHLLHP